MISGLDGLRAIAFLIVLGGHTTDIVFGWMGVQLFFVLSGFLITGILIRMKESLRVKQYFSKFYGRRFLRIFPLYYLYLFILTIAVWQKQLIPMKFAKEELGSIVLPQLQYAYTYVYDFFQASSAFVHTRFLAHLWSLSVEEQFYILWPLVLFLTPKEKLRNLFLVTIAIGPVLRLLAYLVYSNHLIASPLDDPFTAVYVLPFSHVDAFAMGAYISQFQLPQPRKQLAIFGVAVPAVGYLAQYLSVGAITWASLGYEFRMPNAYKFVWGYTLLNYLFALIIYNVARTSLITRVLDSFVLRYLGKISYGLYVYHYAVTFFAYKYVPRFLPNHSPSLVNFSVFLVSLVISIALASVSFYLFERPINNLKDRFFPLKPDTQPVPASQAEIVPS